MALLGPMVLPIIADQQPLQAQYWVAGMLDPSLVVAGALVTAQEVMGGNDGVVLEVIGGIDVVALEDKDDALAEEEDDGPVLDGNREAGDVTMLDELFLGTAIEDEDEDVIGLDELPLPPTSVMLGSGGGGG